MTPFEVLVRLAWTAAIVVAGLLAYRVISGMVLSRANHQVHQPDLFKVGTPVILYFTTPECAPCKTIQRPALQRLQNVLGDRLQIVEINAQDKPDLAKEWGVLSVPTTFLLDASGKARQVNHGATSAEKLLAQLRKEKIIAE
jgi:thiol-disulfide isomerase/thioredoxin